MVARLVRDQKAAGSNPATSTRVKPLDFQGFFYLDRYAVLTFEGSFLLKIGGLSQRWHKIRFSRARKASKIKLCSRFLFRNDMCYIFVLGKFIVLVPLIMFRMVDFLINS